MSEIDPTRSWPEDFPGENGNYECECCICRAHFVGYKRRVVCRRCEQGPTLRSTLRSWEALCDLEDAGRVVVYKFLYRGGVAAPRYELGPEVLAALEEKARTMATSPAVTYDDAVAFLYELAGIRVTGSEIETLPDRFAWVDPWIARMREEAAS